MEEKEVWIEKDEGERIRVSISEFKEKMYLGIRQYYQAGEDEWRPTKKGISMDADKLEELKAALAKL